MTEHVPHFSSPDLPRVFSLPASQALRAGVPSLRPGVLPTGLKRLDELLSPLPSYEAPESTQQTRTAGIPRGHVTEIYGPPGVGKTAVTINIAAQALQAADHVVWIDTGSPIPRLRLRALLQGDNKRATDKTISSRVDERLDECMKRFIHFHVQSLPHLLALIVRPPKDFPPDGCSLLVIDSVSAPFPSYFPNATELKSRLSQGRLSDQQQLQWLLNRKWNVTSDMVNQLVKLAASRQLAVVLLNQTHTKIRGQPRATLYPALAGGSWENCIYTRVVLYRDWPPEGADESQDQHSLKHVRFAEVMKRGGKVLSVRTEENIIPFLIESNGLREVRTEKWIIGLHSSPQPSLPIQVQPRKRKLEEIPNSEDEEGDSNDDYGWMKDDDANVITDDEGGAEDARR